MTSVSFPPTEDDDGEREMIIFPAENGGKKIICTVSYEVLKEHFEADYSDPLFAFMTARDEMEKIAERLINQGCFRGDGTVMITSADI